MLQGVVSDQGTAELAAIPGYTVAGKTGTAQKPGPHGYIPGAYVATFVGMVPASRPRLVVLVTSTSRTGRSTAASSRRPRVRADRLLRPQYLEVPPDLATSTVAWRAGASAYRAAARVAAMDLERLVAALEPVEVLGRPSVEVRDLAYDARAVTPGALFFACPGERADGHDFAAEAVERGAVALVVERALDLPVPQVVVRDARAAMAPAADVFFGEPTRELEVVGVTGTSGKTTTSFLLFAILAAAGRRPGLLGTVEARVGGERRGVVRTTPEAIDLQRLFREMLDAGDRSCAMEASSHASVLHRLDRVRFAVLVFTNLSQDHLDFHGDMESYFEAKRRLFLAEPRPIAVVNVGDEYGRRLARGAAGRDHVHARTTRARSTASSSGSGAASTSRTRSERCTRRARSGSTTTRSGAASSRCAACPAASSRSTPASRST